MSFSTVIKSKFLWTTTLETRPLMPDSKSLGTSCSPTATCKKCLVMVQLQEVCQALKMAGHPHPDVVR